MKQIQKDILEDTHLQAEINLSKYLIEKIQNGTLTNGKDVIEFLRFVIDKNRRKVEELGDKY